MLIVIQRRFCVCVFLMRPEAAEQGSFSNLYCSNLCMSVAVGVLSTLSGKFQFDSALESCGDSLHLPYQCRIQIASQCAQPPGTAN